MLFEPEASTLSLTKKNSKISKVIITAIVANNTFYLLVSKRRKRKLQLASVSS